MPGVGGDTVFFGAFQLFQTLKFDEAFIGKEACRSAKSPLLYWNLNVSPRPVTKLRISIVQYLNTAPLVWGFTNGPLRGKYELSFTVPSQCAEQLRSGRADVAIIPAIEYQRIDDLVILPDMAIASKKHVRSLLIGDPALRVSLAIEKDSLGDSEGQTVCPAATLGVAGAELLYVYDVVGEWRSLTGLPAVLAVWAARRDIATSEVAADFAASGKFGLSQISEITFDAARGLE